MFLYNFKITFCFIYNLTFALRIFKIILDDRFVKNLWRFKGVDYVVNSLIFRIFVAIEIIKINESKTIYSQ